MNALNSETHRHASHGPCRTVCGRDCDGLDIAYAHDDRLVTCEGCSTHKTS